MIWYLPTMEIQISIRIKNMHVHVPRWRWINADSPKNQIDRVNRKNIEPLIIILQKHEVLCRLILDIRRLYTL